MEIAPILPDGAGAERLSWATSTVQPRELAPAESVWRGSMEAMGVFVRGAAANRG